MTCPRCGGQFEEGFVVDRAHADTAKPAHWVEGRAEKGLFGLRVRGRRSFRVTASRCVGCGYLESYAR